MEKTDSCKCTDMNISFEKKEYYKDISRQIKINGKKYKPYNKTKARTLIKEQWIKCHTCGHKWQI